MLSEEILLYAPRSLNEPTGCRFSGLRKICRWSGSLQLTSGVRTATPRSSSRAGSISCKVTREVVCGPNSCISVVLISFAQTPGFLENTGKEIYQRPLLREGFSFSGIDMGKRLADQHAFQIGPGHIARQPESL